MNEGEVISGRYVLGALLGSGGMGRVHVAQDRKLAREVAVKLLVSAAPEAETLRRFQREALAAGSLQHPNIVAVFDAGDEAGRPFIVTELLRGSTLRARLADGPLPAPEAARIARQIAAGLSAAHEKGLVHRDLKPENIFITQDGWVKILDFGLVKLTEALTGDAPPEGTTGAGRIIGTVGYMAPEQVRGRPVDARADLFNFGLVLYEMLSGQRAFKAGSPTETGYATLHREPPPLAKSVPSGLRALVSKTLQKDPAQRIGSAREIVEQLDKTASAPLRPRVSLRLLAAVGAALLVAALAGVGLQRMRAEPALPPIAAGTAPASGTVAVLPFTARDAPQFTWLSEGIVDLLARDFEGSDLRAVDSASVLRAVGGEATADIDKVRGASARLGAKYFVLGRIEQRRGQLVLEAVLHTGDAGVPVAEAVAQGDPAELLTLVRKLSDQLQSRTRTPQDFDARLAGLARRTSRSLQALQAWLEGEQLIRRGHWAEVIGLFQKAVSADPSFALAQYRLGVVAGISEPGLAEDALERALMNVDRLNLPEQALLPGRLALQQGRFEDAEKAFAQATRKYPDDSQTWMELGELYFHYNPLRARSPQESADALQHVLVLDALNTEAMAHLADLAVQRNERALAAKFADRLIALVDDPGLSATARLTLAWARNDPTERQSVLASLLQPGTSRTILANFAFIRLEWLQDFDDAARLSRHIAESESPEDKVTATELEGLLDLCQGRPDAAREAMQLAMQLDRSGDAAYRAAWIDTLEFFPSSPAQLVAARAAAEKIDVSRGAYLLPRKRWVSGVLAVRAGDSAAAEAIAAELQAMPALETSTITTDLALSIRARLIAARGDRAGALALLEKQRLRVPARYAPYYAFVSDRQLRADLLADSGRTREAVQTYDALDIFRAVDPVFLPLAHLGKARVFDKSGDREGAVQEYAAFAELWKSAESAGRADVEKARARIAQLRMIDQSASR